MKYNNQLPMPNLLNEIDEILMACVVFNKLAMIECQSMGFNGMKRKHRRCARYYLNCVLKIENDAFDNSTIKMSNNFPKVDYSVNDIITHLDNWTNSLDETISHLGSLNNSYIEQTGLGCSTAEKAMTHMIKTREKTRRWHARFLKTNSEHDMYDLDDSIHKKEKMKEDIEMAHFYK